MEYEIKLAKTKFEENIKLDNISQQHQILGENAN